MNKSLDKLVKTLGEDQFGTLTSQMNVNPESLNLLKRKGVFPYDFMSDYSKLNATSLQITYMGGQCVNHYP
jgi:hypothetical protein